MAVEPRWTLAELLRDRIGLTGLKISCDIQVCGACTVLVDGLAVSACTYLAVDADGRAVTTVEGLAQDGQLTPLQQAFIDHAAFQCGYCTPGMLMAGTALLAENPHPTREEVVAGVRPFGIFVAVPGRRKQILVHHSQVGVDVVWLGVAAVGCWSLVTQAVPMGGWGHAVFGRMQG